VKNLEDWLKKNLNHPDKDRARKFRYCAELGYDVGMLIRGFIFIALIMAILYIVSCVIN